MNRQEMPLMLAVLVDNNEPELPTKTNLGIGSHLYYV